VPSAPAIYECKACHVRREVTVVDDGASKPLPEKADARATYVKELLRHATCPACKARDPEAVEAHDRSVVRGRLTLAAGYLAVAAAAYFVPKLALLPPILSLIIVALFFKFALRRGFWRKLVVWSLISVAMIAWVIAVPRWAFLVPAALAVLTFWPGSRSSDPFADAAEQLRFAESPYRG
jgi:hypothetical protein